MFNVNTLNSLIFQTVACFYVSTSRHRPVFSWFSLFFFTPGQKKKQLLIDRVKKEKRKKKKERICIYFYNQKAEVGV